MSGKIIDFYAKFMNYRESLEKAGSYTERMRTAMRFAVPEAMDVVAETAVDKYMVAAKVEYIKGRKKPVIKRTQRRKLNIVTSRLARSILNQYGFSIVGGGRKESIREVKVKKGKVIGILGSKVPYAAIHEYGGTISHNNLFGRGIKATIRIPKRSYLRPALRDSQSKINEIFERYINKVVRG